MPAGPRDPRGCPRLRPGPPPAWRLPCCCPPARAFPALGHTVHTRARTHIQTFTCTRSSTHTCARTCSCTLKGTCPARAPEDKHTLTCGTCKWVAQANELSLTRARTHRVQLAPLLVPAHHQASPKPASARLWAPGEGQAGSGPRATRQMWRPAGKWRDALQEDRAPARRAPERPEPGRLPAQGAAPATLGTSCHLERREQDPHVPALSPPQALDSAPCVTG